MGIIETSYSSGKIKGKAAKCWLHKNMDMKEGFQAAIFHNLLALLQISFK